LGHLQIHASAVEDAIGLVLGLQLLDAVSVNIWGGTVETGKQPVPEIQGLNRVAG
jgi:hypothetical protein